MATRITVIKTKDKIYTLSVNTIIYAGESLQDARLSAYNRAVTFGSVLLCEVERNDYTESNVFDFHKREQFI